MARMCGMSYSHFRERFETYYGCSATEWLRRERICRIMEDMTYRPELTLKEVAERNHFLSKSNFHDFCLKRMLKRPGKLKREGYENGVREDWLITITTPKRVTDNDTPKRT